MAKTKSKFDIKINNAWKQVEIIGVDVSTIIDFQFSGASTSHGIYIVILAQAGPT